MTIDDLYDNGVAQNDDTYGSGADENAAVHDFNCNSSDKDRGLSEHYFHSVRKSMNRLLAMTIGVDSEQGSVNTPFSRL